MAIRIPGGAWRWSGIALLVVAAVAGWLSRDRWLPAVRSWPGMVQALGRGARDSQSAEKAEPAHEHDEHDHGHKAHSELESIELSIQARKSIGLKTGKLALTRFERTINVPGIVVERRGWTETRIAAPTTGIVTRVYIIEGEALNPGQPLFDLRLTHEDLVQSQVDYLKLLGELDVVQREVARIRPSAASGAVSQKSLLDRQYEQQKLEASLRAQREALLLHGLPASQIDEIQKTRTLRSLMTIRVPEPSGAPVKNAGTAEQVATQPLTVEEIATDVGRLVAVGDHLVTLSDYTQLYIEGNAFQKDAEQVAEVIRKNWKVTAIIESHDGKSATLPNLQILYQGDQVDPTSRTQHFFVPLPNRETRDAVVDGRRFINWRFKPGQRTQLLVPVEEWPKSLVLPAAAVVQDGVETYAFQENGDHFERRPVHVEHRDQNWVVIAQDGSLYPGDVVALNSAQQLQMAIKNKSGGGIDPHAGHNH